MKTLILQGEQQKFEYLYKHITLDDKDKNLIPYEVETRVFVLDGLAVNKLSDNVFMQLAEEKGKVYSLQGFQDTFNSEEVNTGIDVVRFINVPFFGE